jgi:hypothetical protein
MQESDLGVSIVKSAFNPEVKDILIDYSEIGLGNFLDEDVLREMPILKTIIACRKTWTAIHDQLFLKKVLDFMRACPKFTEAEKENFIKEQLSDAKKARKLGDSLVLILDRLDDFEKPEMLAKVFAMYVRGKTSFEEFRQLAAAIDIGFIEDLKGLIKSPFDDSPCVSKLLRTNLATLTEKMDRDIDGGPIYRTTFAISQLGKHFVWCMTNKP